MPFSLLSIPILIFKHIQSIFIGILLSGIHVYIFQKLIPLSEFSFHLDSIISPKYEVWRFISSQLVHASLLHIGFNLIALVMYSFLEAEIGFLAFARLNFLLIILCPLLQFVLYYILWKRYDRVQYRDMHAVGYSCVLFGIMTFSCMNHPFGILRLLGFIPIPQILFPIFALGVTQIIVPRSSFLGHMCGVLIGIPLGIPIFVEWMNWWWLTTSILIVAAITLVNIKLTRSDLGFLSWLEVKWIPPNQNQNQDEDLDQDEYPEEIMVEYSENSIDSIQDLSIQNPNPSPNTSPSSMQRIQDFNSMQPNYTIRNSTLQYNESQDFPIQISSIQNNSENPSFYNSFSSNNQDIHNHSKEEHIIQFPNYDSQTPLYFNPYEEQNASNDETISLSKISIQDENKSKTVPFSNHLNEEYFPLLKNTTSSEEDDLFDNEN